MDRTERFYRIDQLLRNQRSVSLRQLIDNLEVSRATIRRDLEYLRDRIGAPSCGTETSAVTGMTRTVTKRPANLCRACGSVQLRSTRC